MPGTEPVYISSPEFNWLDLVSENKAGIDSRTYEVHQVGWLPSPCTYRWTRKLTRGNLDMLDGRRVWPFMEKWIDETVAIFEGGGYEPVPMDDSAYLEAESFSDSDSESDADFHEFMPKPLQLEAAPPYTKPTPKNTLYETHLQTQSQSSYRVMSVLSSDIYHASESQSSLHMNFDVATAVVYSPSSTEPVESLEELNIGKLIAGKLRHALAHSREAYRSLQGSLKL